MRNVGLDHGVAAVRNLATNPSFETTSGTVTVRTNLCLNPGLLSGGTGTLFSTPGFGTAPTWGYTTGAGAGSPVDTFARATAKVAFSGAIHQDLFNGATTYFSGTTLGATAQVTPGAVYTISAYVRSSIALSVGIQAQYAAGSAGVGGDYRSASVTLVPNTWTRMSVTSTAPTGAAVVRLDIDAGAAYSFAIGDTLDVTGLLVEASGTLGPYFDGATRPPVRTNLASNPVPIFGASSTGWGNYWPGSVTTATNAAGAFGGVTGRRSFTVTTAGTASTAYWGFLTSGAPFIIPGLPYSASLLYRASTATRVHLTVEFYDTTGTFTGSVNGTGIDAAAGQVVTPSASNMVAPAGSATVKVWAITENAVATLPVGAVVDVSAVLIEQSATLNPYFDGSTSATGTAGYAWGGTANNSPSYSYDPDFSVAWSGTANSSTSVLRGVGVANSSNVIQSSAWSVSGGHSARRIATGSSNDTSMSQGGDTGGLRLGMLPGHTYTALGTIYLPTPQTGTLNPQARSIVFFQMVGGSYHSTILATAPNVAGAYPLRGTFTVDPTATEAFVRLYNGASQGNGDVFWDDFALVDITNGPYVGAYFDGRSAGARWDGAVDASTSSGYLPIS